nr:uncharacterized protein LOC117850373 isoform X2 [Setaria viridis]
MFFITLCALAVLYWLGLYISTGISLWRLVEHDYGNTDGGSNLEPSLYILYSVAVAQGVLFRCRSFYSCTQRTQVVNRVKEHYELNKIDLVLSYVKETKAGCKKDILSFPDGRWNLVTYAVNLLKTSERPEKHISDVRAVFLASSTKQQRPLKQLLIGNESFSPMISKLLQMMHPKSLYSRETRENAAGIVAVLPDQIHLEEFTGGVQSILSLLDTSEEYPWLPERYHRDCSFGLEEEPDQRDWLLQIHKRYKIQKMYERGEQEEPEDYPREIGGILTEYRKMFVQGLCIFAKLADDKDNYRIISNTEGLVSRITTPLLSSRLHEEHHEEWTRIAAETLALMYRFMATPGESGAKLRHQISSNGEATIRALQGILECDRCYEKRVLRAIATEILLDVCVDTSSIMTRWSATIIQELLRIFFASYTQNELKLFQKLYSSKHWMKKRSYIRNLAGEILVMLSSQSETSATVILHSGNAPRDLTNILVCAKSNTYRMRAAEFLERLCSDYTNDDYDLESLQEAILNAMPKVLTEILGCGSTEASTQAGTEENKPRYSAAEADLEGGPALPDNEKKNISSSHCQNGEEHGDSKLQEALLSLCATVCQKWISTDPDLARRFDEIASKICSEEGKPVVPFTLLVEEAGEILKKKND